VGKGEDMNRGDYKHSLLGIGLLAVLLFLVPSSGVLLAVSSLIVIVFALFVGLLATVFFLCERSVEKLSETKKKWGTAQIKTSMPSRP
jgi:hypothetical protein